METQMQTTQNPTVTPINQRSGFFTNIMPVLSKDGQYVYYFLAGDITITEHANRFKGLLGIPYTPKAPSEKQEYRPRAGLHAKIRLGLSKDGQWVTLYLPGTLGRVSNHVNALKHIFKIPYEKKAPKLAA